MNATDKISARWWMAHEKDEEPHKIIESLVHKLKLQSQSRISRWRRFTQVYQSINLASPMDTWVLDEGVLGFNHAHNFTQTWVNKICKTRVLPLIVTKGGDYSLRRKSGKANKFLEGIFEENKIYDKDALWALDACLYAIGVARIETEFGRVKIKRVMPWELVVDEREWRDGTGRTAYQLHHVDRFVLAEMFPDKADLIMSLPTSETDDFWFRQRVEDDLVLVTESFHLKSGPDATDGRHALTVQGGTLVDESFEDEDLPYAFFIPEKPVYGLYGNSLMAQLAPAQAVFNKFCTRHEESVDLSAALRLLVQDDIGFNRLEMANMNGAVINVKDINAVREWNIQPFHPDNIKFLYETIPRMMSETTGIGQMAAMSKMPAGITAAKALEMVDDNQSERFTLALRARDDFFVRIAELVLRAAAKLAKEDKSYAVIYKTRKAVDVLKAVDVIMNEDDFSVTVMPSSFLAKTPAARMQQAQDLVSMGLVAPNEIARSLDLPDIESITADITSPYDAVDFLIENIEDGGDYRPPEPAMDLALCKKRGMAAYNRAIADAAPPEIVESLLQFAMDADDALKQQEPTPALAPMAPPMPGMPSMPLPGAAIPGAPPEGMPQ